MKQTQRALCLVFALFMAVFFLSGLFLTLEHDCTHESCQICSFVTSIKKILAALFMALAVYGAAEALTLLYRGDGGRTIDGRAVTPITLKVKLSN